MSNQVDNVKSVKMGLDESTRTILAGISTATITMILLKKGLRNAWIRKSMPLVPSDERAVGRAFTMRFVPAREDLATTDSLSSPQSTRGAIDEMPAGSIAVVDAMGLGSVGIFGDILCARMKNRDVRGLITDGAMRDLDGIRRTGLPIWCNGIAAPPSVAGLTFVGWQEPIACGGVAIFPGNIIVADSDGAVVIPDPLLDTVLELGPEAELFESWVLAEVMNGRKLVGLYPPDAEAAGQYEAWLAARQKSKTIP